MLDGPIHKGIFPYVRSLPPTPNFPNVPYNCVSSYASTVRWIRHSSSAKKIINSVKKNVSHCIERERGALRDDRWVTHLHVVKLQEGNRNLKVRMQTGLSGKVLSPTCLSHSGGCQLFRGKSLCMPLTLQDSSYCHVK